MSQYYVYTSHAPSAKAIEYANCISAEEGRLGLSNDKAL